ncbi:MAG: GNAT family N-acetyltransferase [Betaproteobacteria bacterium]|nr:GNAT family N-acetyltransferase [Betaproteobacteria bacterium]
MPDRFVIRRERPDQPEVEALLAALDGYLMSLYPPEANHILDVQALLGADVAFFVARDGEQAMGTAAYRRMPGEPETGGVAYGEVKRMYVDPAYRGRRLGVQLLGALEDGLRADGCRLAVLETGRHQHEAVALYERCGYTERAAFGGYPDNGLSVFYGKTL